MIFIPFLSWNFIALIGIVAYTCVTRQYQYRERDESDNIYCYAEDYNANAQDEKAAMTMITLIFTLSINKNS